MYWSANSVIFLRKIKEICSFACISCDKVNDISFLFVLFSGGGGGGSYVLCVCVCGGGGGLSCCCVI